MRPLVLKALALFFIVSRILEAADDLEGVEGEASNIKEGPSSRPSLSKLVSRETTSSIERSFKASIMRARTPTKGKTSSEGQVGKFSSEDKLDLSRRLPRVSVESLVPLN